MYTQADLPDEGEWAGVKISGGGGTSLCGLSKWKLKYERWFWLSNLLYI